MARFKRTEMFMRIADGEDSTLFVPVSDHIGKESPYKNPLAIAAVAVSPTSVLFSLLHPTRKNRSRYTAEVSFPQAQLSRLERKAEKNTSSDPTTVFVSMDDQIHELTLSVDPNGLAHVSDPNNSTFELPVRGVMMDIFWFSPKVKRQVAVTFTGNFGKPGTDETLARAVAMSLNSLSGLADFRTVSTISRVDVPKAAGTVGGSTRMSRAAIDHVSGTVPVYLYREDGQPVASGSAEVLVDLVNANPSLPVLMCRYTPSAEIDGVFHPYLQVMDRAIAAHFTSALTADFIEQIVCDVVLGDVDDRTAEAVGSALSSLPGVQLSPSRFQLMS